MCAYGAASLAPSSAATPVMVGTGCLLYAMSLSRASGFHRVFAFVALGAFMVAAVSGSLDATGFVEGMRDYFAIVAVFLALSVAGYPIRAERLAAQVRGLVAAMGRRGLGARPASVILGHLLGAVLDVGALVLVDAVVRRAAPKDRVESLLWAARSFSFAPLWTNLNIFTVTILTLTGATYTGLLSVSLPYALGGMALILVLAQRGKGEVEQTPADKLDRGAWAVLLYPVLLVGSVALVGVLFPALSLTFVISAVVLGAIVLIAALASVLARRTSPLKRLGAEAVESVRVSHPEFVIFGSAGVLVVALGALGALAPVGDALSALPVPLVAPALALILAAGFMLGIHVIPMLFLVDAAFPLDGGPVPALWALSILLGSQAAILLSPFSNTTTMLSRLTRTHPLQIGPAKNWRFQVCTFLGICAYLTLLTFILL
jgi:hypothetical protein